jgi:hypothetical protein
MHVWIGCVVGSTGIGERTPVIPAAVDQGRGRSMHDWIDSVVNVMSIIGVNRAG